MESERPPWPDAERIPEDRVRDVFRSPPGVPSRFARSALIVGARGAGKTMLFRYLKETSEGFVTHIYLSTEFPSLTKAGYGPLTSTYSHDEEIQLSGKATALLALAISERLLRKGLTVPQDAFLHCFPDKLRQTNLQVTASWITDVRYIMNREALSSFDAVAQGSPLVSFVSSVGDYNRHTLGPMLLLFDRADAVPSPALLPVFELLDQAGLYTVLVATRPGIGGEALSKLARVIAPGDSYDVMHLGLYPRSSEWKELVQQGLEVQFGLQFTSLPQTLRDCIAVFARDSIKVAVELASRCIFDKVNCDTSELTGLLEDFRESRLTAAQRTLQTYVEDFRQSMRNIRSETLEQHGSLTPGVLVTIRQRSKPLLFLERTRLDLFVDAALRSGAICMPEGERWVPGLRPTRVEIPPLLIWTKQDKVWTDWCPPAEITINASELTGRGGGGSRRPTIFIAYRVDFEKSKRFRNDIKGRIQSHPDLADAVVLDGEVPPGAKWPEVIRKRISQAHIVVGDLEGLRPDILFELGFAYGLGRVFIPVFESIPNIERIPTWLKGRQLGHYANIGGLDGIVSSIVTHLSDSEFVKSPAPPRPISSLVVWLRTLPWNTLALQQLQTAVNQEGLTFETYSNGDLTGERIIRRAASAALLIVSLDRTEIDGLVHYIAGAVVSRPRMGAGRKSLSRRVIVLEEKPRKFSALSLQKCEDSNDIVTICNAAGILDAAGVFVRAYKKWVRGSPE